MELKLKLLSIFFLIAGPLQVVFNEPLARLSKSYYEAMPFSSYFTDWSLGYYRVQSVIGGIIMTVVGIIIIAKYILQ